ncbi:Kelch repeat-containing protein [Parasphingorhabdus sp.]|uniref:Kelch repeat-containing protein n=1 Tax=Parasphingorhabdus sp. TaxID=2709688 RepID=UPI002F9402CE
MRGLGGKYLASLFALLTLGACGQETAEQPLSATAEFSLPVPMTNNAVAMAGENPVLYSFNGLKSGKSWQDTSHAAFACVISTKSCEEIASVPVSEGRLASAAVTVADKIYIFGGYSVAENGDELSTPELFAYDPDTGEYSRLSDMPTPVDDMVALPYQDRYIYLVSGWHDEGNVALVQLYDTRTDTWRMATEFPGKPVFGHAGGLAGNSMIITDGVAVAGLVDGKRKFVAAPFAWRGDIDPNDPARITWRAVDAHPGGPLYRMAATGDDDRGLILFAGGGDKPYNFDGIGFDGVPASPTDRIFGYDLNADQWIELGKLAKPSMDHRGLVKSGSDYYIIGGMNADQAVTAQIMKFRIDD